MAIAFRNITSVVGASAASAILSAPAGLADNDILVFFLYKENTAAVTWPAGFTEVGAITASDSSFRIAVAWKRAASESGTYTASWTGATWRAACLSAYSGCTTSGDPNDATPTTIANGSQTNQETCPSITTVSANCMIVAMAGAIAGPNLTAPSGMTLRASVDNVGSADVLQAGTGASGQKVYTCTAVGQTAGITIALKEPAAANMVSKAIPVIVPGIHAAQEV